ncbi:fimbrial protein [Enterobacter bugandensis]|uniref:fimbrial protein n=1 Tax=Enterobacter bugandensis TaxID=881260 RepID=UPI0006651654|nr:fimbrial protein [Enterobacter bugandensis]
MKYAKKITAGLLLLFPLITIGKQSGDTKNFTFTGKLETESHCEFDSAGDNNIDFGSVKFYTMANGDNKLSLPTAEKTLSTKINCTGATLHDYTLTFSSTKSFVNVPSGKKVLATNIPDIGIGLTSKGTVVDFDAPIRFTKLTEQPDLKVNLVQIDPKGPNLKDKAIFSSSATLTVTWA